MRFTLKTWNLTTHRIDPDVDESRDYVVDSLAASQRLAKLALVPGCGAAQVANPRRNLTGDTYFTDGNRALLLLSVHSPATEFVEYDAAGQSKQ